jgi:hypothetical protein
MAFNQFPQKGGIPSGNTAARPAGAVQGDTYYNGELGLLEIYSNGQWIPCSAPAGIPTVVGVDVGTSRAYGSGALTFTFTAGTNGGSPYGFVGTAVLGAVTYTTGATTSTTATLVLAGDGTHSVSGTAYNGFGTSPASVPTNVAVTTVPQAPTIGTTTLSGGLPVVNWTLNSTGGKVLSSITITPYLNGTTAETSRTASTTSSTSFTFLVGQLTEDASYTFKVKTTNANGDSLDSSASNSVTVDTQFSGDYLVVAGGGAGGGNYQGGGGGAGGYRTTIGGTALSLSTGTNYTVTVGAGGASVNTNGVAGNDGGNSVFSSITSTGGGGGGCNGVNGRNGGSGGGAGSTIPAPASQIGLASPAGQGNNGGIGWDGAATCTLTGGGGGAGGVGGNSAQACTPAGNGGNGGVGLANNITGSSVFYAGGGGGNTDNASGVGGTGGNGGGGNGARTGMGAGQPGTANTGGGGGGSTSNAPYNGSGAGGSGVVILRYPDTKTITIGAGLTGTESAASGGYKRATITAGTGNVSW